MAPDSRRVVGDEAPWKELEALRQGPRFAGLSRLKGLPFVSASEFNQIALEIQALEHHRCREFSAQVLETFVTCPYCRFPEDGATMADLEARIADLEARLDDLWDRWQAQVFSELPGLTGRLALLSPARRGLVEDLGHRGALPGEVSDELLAALHELASDLQPVELNLADLAQALLARGSALTVDDLQAGWHAYVDALLKGCNQELVRFKIVLDDSGEGIS